jgi:peptide deformylase
MSLRPIVLSDDPLLRETSRRVRRVSPDLQELVDDMIETMHAGNGIGLTAVQVGVPERVIVVQALKEPEEDTEEVEEEELRLGELYVVINPELARTSREMEEGIEGCLSVPGWVGMVSRHCSVTVKGMDLEGKDVRIKADGFLARVFQHEIDHCHGVLFIDHIDDPEKIWPVEEGEEEATEAAAHLRQASPE